MLNNKTIGSLLARIANRDKDALAELWRGAGKGIYSFILSYMDDRQLAEDVLQETFISIYKGAMGFRPGTNARAWIFTIARNNIVTMLRKRRESIQRNDEMAAIADERHMEETIGERDEVNRLLETMDETSKRIVILHAVSGMKHRETAAILGIPVGTVYRRYSESMKRLKAAFEGNNRGGRENE